MVDFVNRMQGGYNFGQNILKNNQRAQMQADIDAGMSDPSHPQHREFMMKYPQQAQARMQALQQAIKMDISQDARKQDRFYKKAYEYSGLFNEKDKYKLQANLIKKIGQQINTIESEGGNPSHQLELLERVQSGDLGGAKMMIDNAVDQGQVFGNLNLSASRAKPMTEYQKESIRLREMEKKNDALKASQMAATNKLKEKELSLKITANEQKIKSKKRKLSQEIKDKNIATKSVIKEGQITLDLIKQISNHKGFSGAVGQKDTSSLWGILDTPISGTDEADFVNLLEQLDSKNFLTAVSAFKQAGGAGSLSDAEGKKLAGQIASLQRSSGEPQFRKNLGLLIETINNQINVAREQMIQPLESANDPTKIKDTTSFGKNKPINVGVYQVEEL